MADRQKYTVLVPFPTGGGHWSSIGQELELLDVQASALRSAGRLELSSALAAQPQAQAAESATVSTKAAKAPTRKAE